jgi:uncharacterized protein with HEPN domain
MMRFACIKQLEIIGEASVHISEEIKIKFREIVWGQIKGMRRAMFTSISGLIQNWFGKLLPMIYLN